MDWFGGLNVLSLESRRADEMHTLIGKYGGRATVAPSLREQPQDTASLIGAFADALARGEVHVLVGMTGVGTRLFLRELVRAHPEALPRLAELPIVARGNKPQAALKEFGLKAHMVPRPHTWREVQDHLVETLQPGQHAFILEYGDPTPAPLLKAVQEVGAEATSVAVYRCIYPENVEPLRAAVRDTIDGAHDILLLSSSKQMLHFMALARDMGLDGELRAALRGVMVASIGPSCTETVSELGVRIDLEANPHKMGILVRAAAEHAPKVLERKRGALAS